MAAAESKHHPSLTRGIRIGIGILLALGLLAAGYWLGSRQVGGDFIITKLHPANVHYQYINPLLGIEIAEKTDFSELQGLKDELNKAVNTAATAGAGVSSVSVYFREMETGHWLGINIPDSYQPASLYKVPIMIAYYKKAESVSGTLDEKLVFQGSEPGPHEKYLIYTQHLTPGQSYSVSELIDDMIKYSDNDALKLLTEHIDGKYLADTFGDLGIPLTGPGSDGITAQRYSLFFRTLYNATYLDRDDSERALKLLSQAEYKDGLVAGLPSGVQIAHKFGEHGDYQGDALTGLELHDCGIIYDKKLPYLLCVMTKGNNLQAQQQIIGTLSKISYNYIEAE